MTASGGAQIAVERPSFLKGIIVGFGFIAQGHIAGYANTAGLEITAVVDTSAERRRAAAVAGLAAYSSIDDALAALAPDFLDVCTPPTLHHEGIIAAIRSGVPVVCEKPVFVPVGPDYEDTVAAVIGGSTLVYPCQNYKFAPAFARVREILASGDLGQVRFARIDIARQGHARGVPEWRPDWRREPAFSAGGVLRDHGPHATYLLLSLVLGQSPLEVSVVAGSVADTPEFAKTEDTVLMRLRNAEAVECDVTLSWAAGLRNSRYLFVGTRGFISVDNDVLTWSNRGHVVTETVRSDFDDAAHSAWFSDMFAEFLRLLRSGRAGLDEAAEMIAESLRTTAVIEAGYASCRSGGGWQPVPEQALFRLHPRTEPLKL